MESLKGASNRITYAAIGLIASVAIVAVGLTASAAQITERSIELSNSSVSADNVNYQVTFMPVESASAFLLEFCSNTPIIGQSCDTPTDFDSSNASTTSADFSVSAAAVNRVAVSGPITGGNEVSVPVASIVNPSVSGAMYVRIVSFEEAAQATAQASSVDPVSLEGAMDRGGAAVSITDTIGVSGTVLESLTFCASQELITDDCETTVNPVLRLGEVVGDTVALQPGVLSDGDIYIQLSTNASGGATVRLKSTATDCGGLLLAGATDECHILPALDTGIDADAGDAKFGVDTTLLEDQENPSSGTLAPVVGSVYVDSEDSGFALGFSEDNQTGVTSPFGDLFLDTENAPANNQNMRLTFGASVNNDTPAGTYSTDVSLIAVGKF